MLTRADRRSGPSTEIHAWASASESLEGTGWLCFNHRFYSTSYRYGHWECDLHSYAEWLPLYSVHVDLGCIFEC